MMKKKILAGILAVVMSITMIPGNLMEKVGMKENAEAAVTLQNPRIEADSSMEAGQKVTYDCVWFGFYPQTEIVDKAGTCGTYGKVWGRNSDYEVNGDLYNYLKNTTGWDNYGDFTTSDGNKYRRMRNLDVTYCPGGDSYYDWNSYDTYHYFRYEPIKWRLLSINSTGGQALLLADNALDNMKYNNELTAVTWKTSTLRSWLNGYSSSFNKCMKDYTNSNFINTAFSSSERDAIISTYLNNDTTGPYSKTNGEINTTDKLFLLSSYDMYNDKLSAFYGFIKDDNTVCDEARRKMSSTYAKAMGVESNKSAKYLGNCLCWIRSPGPEGFSAEISPEGSVNPTGNPVHTFRGVCPALYLDITASDSYSYAGTVCTNGTADEVKPEINYDIPEKLFSKKVQNITASSQTVPINKTVFSLGVKTSGNGKLTYKSSNAKVATISSVGKIMIKGYGSTTITITASETSTYKKATKAVTITVVPKKMKIKSVKSPGKGKLQIKWAKDKVASSYQIQFSQDWKFNSKKSKVYAKTISKKLTALKKPVTGLTSKKKYYVRIRTLKKINGKTLQGVWSATKEIKIK